MLLARRPGHGDGAGRDGYGSQGAVRALVGEPRNTIGNGRIPKVKAVLLDGETVKLRIRDRGGKLTITHAQVEVKGERVRFGRVVQALAGS